MAVVGAILFPSSFPPIAMLLAQLGHGDMEARTVPTRIEAMAGSGDNATTPMAAVTRCAAQAGQSGFVTSGGAVLMCGVQMWGRLGTPIWAPSNMPAPVVGLDGSDGAPIVVDLALGNRFVRSCCWRVHSFGTRLWVATICGHATPPSDCQNRHYHRRHLSFLFLFFQNIFHYRPPPSHSVAVTAEGAVWEWGSNECGKFGLGPHGFDTVVPHPVPLTTLDGLVATAMACGSTSYIGPVGRPGFWVELCSFIWGAGRWLLLASDAIRRHPPTVFVVGPFDRRALVFPLT